MKIKVLKRNNIDNIDKSIFICVFKKVVHSITCFVLISLLFSCFSSEQKVAPSPTKSEKNILEETKPASISTVQQEKETQENTQAEEPIRIQSTMTPAIDIEKQQQPVSQNTVEINSSLKEIEVSQSNEDQTQETLPNEDTEEEEKPSPSAEPFDKVKLGMNYEEVVSLLGEPDYLITQSSDKQMKLYRWNREEKVLYGRFENGILKRYSGRAETNENIPNPLTRELYDQLKEGMELDEVVAILQRAGTQVSSDNKGGNLYLWTDKAGSSFSARFENNKLVRKSGFYVRPAPVIENQIIEETQTDEISESTVEENTAEEIETNPTEEKEEEQPQTVEESISQQPNRITPQSVNRQQMQTRPENRRIIYAGSPKKYSDENDFIKQSSIRRKVKLPNYTYQIRDGSYEIRIYNPLDTSVKVGLRSGKKGKDISIPAGGEKTVKVPRGNYQFVYIRDDAPTELQQGGTVQIDGLFVGDIEVMLLK